MTGPLIDVSSAPSLVRTLTERGETLAFCESLTAGLASATAATVPGASKVLRGGLVTYATDLKGSLAGVPAAVLDRHGPVSSVTARHMARGAQSVCGATWGVALTGVAGPDPQDGHPVGEVHIAVAGPSRTVSHPAAEILADIAVAPELSQFALVPGAREPVRVLVGERQQIRELAVAAALHAVLYEVERDAAREQNGGDNR
ncbi:CinA family protein [Corynebacterium urinipleomorphum]|uniref:CinA family protein n=1 Tax=Corynebacterium urinipleomorphum TaxID=1852380 RepID=UPI000B35AC18|nr:CinA family protein [Corynebacterium urinipleomorphum]